MMHRSRIRSAVVPATLAALTAAVLIANTSSAEQRGDHPRPSRTGVSDYVDLGDRRSERKHDLEARGRTDKHGGTVTAGRVTDEFTARSVADGGTFSVEIDVRRREPLTVQLRELRPDDAWGEAFGYRVYLDDRLVYVRDNATADPGGGPHTSIFIDSGDPSLRRGGSVELTIEGTSDEPAFFSEIWAYADIEGMVRQQDMRVPDNVVFLLGQDYLGEGAFRQKLDYITENFEAAATANEHVGLGFAVLDYPPNRSAGEMADNYELWLQLSRDYDLPFVVKQHTEWEGTPLRVPDGKGGYFGDLEYQQVLWSPQDQTGPDKDVYTNPDGDVQRLDDLMGDAYEPKYGLSVPNVWGSTPWLTWHHPDLNQYYEDKINESMDQLTPLYWQMQANGEADRLMPAFSTTTESVYWSKRNNIGVWDVVYTDYNDGVVREDIFADLNPYTVAAAAEDGVTLDPTDGGWSEEEKAWLYRNQSHPQQFFADILFEALPRERISVAGHDQNYPDDLLRHNVHGEVYSRLQEPYYSSVYPSSTQGIVERARPGAQFISTDGHTPGGFGHLQKMREFGRLANPNLENSVSTVAAEKTLLLRQAFVNGSRYTTPYNWHMSGSDEVTEWVQPYLADLHPYDVSYDGAADDSVRDTRLTQSFTAGEVRLANQVDLRIERVGAPRALRLTLHEGGADGRIVGMRYLSGREVDAGGWTTFDLPIVQLDTGQTYTIEIEQLDGRRPAYSFATRDGQLLHRVGVDMLAERDRSLVIQWRRDAVDAIEHVREDLTAADTYAADALDDAKQALSHNRYVEAYEIAMKADSLRFPVLYQSDVEARLDPFPVTVESTSTIDTDVRAFTDDRRLDMLVTPYSAGSATFEVRGIDDPTVYVDRSPVEVDRDHNRVTFTVNLAEGHSREIAVLAEGEDPPQPWPSEPPVVTDVSTPDTMFAGRANTVTASVTNTTNEEVALTAAVSNLPDGWSSESATATLLPRQSADLDVTITPPTGPGLPVPVTLEVTAQDHDVREGMHELTVMAVPHSDDVVVALDAGSLTSPVVDGYQQLAPQHFWDPQFRDYGWVGNPPQSRDRGAGTDAVRRDFVNDSSARTLRLSIPAGGHDIFLLVGDASFPSAPTHVHAGDELLAQTPALGTGEFAWLTIPVDGGPDGRALDLALSSDAGQHWHLAAALVSPRS